MRYFLATLALSLFAFGTAGAQAVPVETLVAEKVRDTYGAELPADAKLRITFQRSDIEEAELISAFWMDRTTGQFLANAVQSGGAVSRLQGLVVMMITIPVPLRRMVPGELIGPDDLQDIDLAYARLGPFTVTEPDKLIGKEVRRVLTPGRAVMAQSVAEPLVIARGDKVSIRFSDGLLFLSAPGRALDDGYRGAEIRVVNLVSNTLLSGIARPGGLVEIIR